MLLVSVIICTRNRSASLARTLDSIVKAATRVTESWELLVVDNGSTDDTADTIVAFADRLPVRRVFEATPGLSNARNAGVRESRGEFVLWTDDDVLVDENWLAAWSRAFRNHPDTVVFGGRSRPVYEAPAQDWFEASEEALRPLLAIRDDPEWETIGPGRIPYGLNFAIRGAEQRANLYDPELGVAPGRRRGGEEQAMILGLLEQGGSGLWVWDAHVSHIIPSDRQTEAYIRLYYLAAGFDKIARGEQRGRVFAAALTLARYLRHAAAFRLKRPRSIVDAVPSLVAASLAMGRLRYLLGLNPA